MRARTSSKSRFLSVNIGETSGAIVAMSNGILTCNGDVQLTRLRRSVGDFNVASFGCEMELLVGIHQITPNVRIGSNLETSRTQEPVEYHVIADSWPITW